MRYVIGVYAHDVTPDLPAFRDNVSGILTARGYPTDLTDLAEGGLMFESGSRPLDRDTTRQLLGVRGVREVSSYVLEEKRPA